MTRGEWDAHKEMQVHAWIQRAKHAPKRTTFKVEYTDGSIIYMSPGGVIRTLTTPHTAQYVRFVAESEDVK